MATPNIPGSLEMKGRPSHKPIEEKLQKHLDKFLYGGGRPSAQKIRDFLNGTWLGEPLSRSSYGRADRCLDPGDGI